MNRKPGRLSQIRRLSKEEDYQILSYVSTRFLIRTSLLLLSSLLSVSAAEAQGPTTSFTYQGRLTDGGAPANTNYDLQFTLWDAAVGGTQQPQPAPAALTKTNVAVTGGVFSVLLDFGVSAFPGAERFLEVGVRPGGTAVAFTLLAPRQQISSTPYALRTLNATAADSLSKQMRADQSKRATTTPSSVAVPGLPARRVITMPSLVTSPEQTTRLAATRSSAAMLVT